MGLMLLVGTEYFNCFSTGTPHVSTRFSTTRITTTSTRVSTTRITTTSSRVSTVPLGSLLPVLESVLLGSLLWSGLHRLLPLILEFLSCFQPRPAPARTDSERAADRGAADWYAYAVLVVRPRTGA
jgi:hypothetical protein